MKRAALQNSKRFLLTFALATSSFFALGLPNAHAAVCTTTSSTFTGDGTTGTLGVAYTLLEFRAPGTCDWTVPSTRTVDVLIVGGGGGAGFGSNGGGGGAGQVVTNNSSLTLSASSVISITVGAGGSGGWSASSGSWSYGSTGGTSSFGAYASAVGGGGGGGNNGSKGGNGGSGGGGAGTAAGTSPSNTLTGGSGNTSANSGWTARGNNGGTGSSNSGAGGGGASAVGANPSGGAGAGGAGVTIFGKKVGGGGAGWGSANSTGLEFGGGYGILTDYTVSSACSTSCQGTANTGGGGGGGNAGGSGLVALRYQSDLTAPTITGPSSATGSSSSTSVSENSTAVHTFTANETVTWTISGTDNSFFSITSSGVLTITARNFESPADAGADNTYVVIITATDTASNATSQTLTVTITNVNEAPTITTNSSAATYSITQAENISAVVTYAATDVDAGSSLSWSVSGTDAADFVIVSGTGALSFASNPDYEAPADNGANNVYDIVVTVSDGSLTDTQTVTVTITNANESASLGTPSVSGSIYKGSVATITVTSTVAGKVRFLVGGKRISTCLSVSTTGSYPNFTATCSWKPAVQNKQILTASITPTDNTFSSSTSAQGIVSVGRRTTTR